MKENIIEWYNDAPYATLTLNQKKYINKMRKLHAQHPRECDFLQNKDGSVLAHVPRNWIKISRPREVSEEQREAARQRMKNMRNGDE